MRPLVSDAKAFALDPNRAHFRWNPQFLEVCGTKIRAGPPR
jgi:hypothetical protein